TTKDAHFEVVLLNSRRKIKSSDAASSVPGKVMFPASNNSQGNASSTSGSYITGKKLFMADTIASSGSMIYLSRLLPAGEINDFARARMWDDFDSKDFATYSAHWRLYPLRRFVVILQNQDHNPVINHGVFLINKRNNDTAWSAVTDNTGQAELW